MFTIKNSNNGLRSSDVLACNDIEQLREWQQEQLMDVSFIQLQHDNAKNYFAEHGEYEDTEHYRKLKTAKRLQKKLYDLICLRIDAVKDKEVGLKDAIINLLKSNMEDERWETLVEEAKLNIILEKQLTIGTS